MSIETTTTETTIAQSPGNTPLTFYTDRVRMPDIPENSRGEYEIKANTLSPKYSEHQVITFYNTAQRTAIEEVKAYPPETVGELWAKYLYLVNQNASTSKQLAAVVSALGTINDQMNEFAEDQNFCDSYEQALSNFNVALSGAGYHGSFQFVGRTEEVQVTVRRQRTILEDTVVTMTRSHGDDIDEEVAQELADECSYWDEVDSDYNTDCYEIVDVSSS